MICIFLLNTFGVADWYQHLRKARAVLCSSPLERLGEASLNGLIPLSLLPKRRDGAALLIQTT
jgi:hypothetical protein